MPVGMEVFNKVMLEELKEPKAPETLENPINAFYNKSYLGAVTASLGNPLGKKNLFLYHLLRYFYICY